MTDSDSNLPDEGLDPNTASMFGDSADQGTAYQVLARKYRPRTFDDMVGQEAMVRTLTNAFKTGRIAHAFMLTGVRGVGKTTTARLLARALNYESDKIDTPSITLDPQGRHCHAIMEGRHPEILELDAASRSGVAEMRELLDGVRYAPVDARYKVYIIDEVHMLSMAAFNALLKTLEEPPAHVKFIFATTEIRKVPVTVLSRCQRFNLQRLTPDALADHLGRICKKEGAKADKAALALIARAAEGSARDALSILDQAIVQADNKKVSETSVRDMLGLADRSRLFDLLQAALEGQHKQALAETEAQLQEGAEAQVLIKDLLDAVAEISRAQAMGKDYVFAGPKDWEARTKAMSAKVTMAQSSRYWKILLNGFEDCGKSPDPNVAAQMVVLRLAAAASLPSPEDAARMLAAGGQGSGGTAPDGGASGGKGGSAPTAMSAHKMKRQGGAAPIEAEQPIASNAPGPVLSTLGEICAALQSHKEINLLYDIEKYVRPATISYGQFGYAAAPGAPDDFAMRLKFWLEETTGVEWRVFEAKSNAKSLSELKSEEDDARLQDITSQDRVADVMRAFPEARIVRVESVEKDADGNIVRVDFSRRRNFNAHDEQDMPDRFDGNADFDDRAYDGPPIAHVFEDEQGTGQSDWSDDWDDD